MTMNPHVATMLNKKLRSHEVQENGDIIFLSPLNDGPQKDAMAIFQEFSDYVLKWDGHGYKVVKTHVSFSQGVHDYDLIVVERQDRQKVS